MSGNMRIFLATNSYAEQGNWLSYWIHRKILRSGYTMANSSQIANGDFISAISVAATY